MRIFTRLFSLLFILLPAIIWANVIVHGKVRYTNGVGVSGVAVHVVGDSALAVPGACYQTHIRHTDSLGSYTDTLVCNASMSTVLVWIMNCNGNIIRQNYTLTANQNVESNFIYCDSTVNQCHSSFTVQSSNLEVHFFSGGSAAGNPATDSISNRTWTFGDGTILNGNTINPVHLYTQAGTYTVCLKIRTYAGCEHTFCLPVQLGTNSGCNASFAYYRPNIVNTIAFSSNTSSAIIGDSIISRKWKFGDGDSLLGNVINPQHTYPQYGTYNVCLTIKSQLGCEKITCSAVNLPNPATNCHAFIFYDTLPATATGYPIKFTSRYTMLTTGDSIVHCQWTYGDNLSGSDSLHVYSLPGIYNACLTIQTAAGCTSTACTTVVIYSPQYACHSSFFTQLPGSNLVGQQIYFNGNPSSTAPGDSIIQRIWNFGDGTSGTGIAVSHIYTQPSFYNICLTIVAASGCRDSSCIGLAIIAAPLPHCEAVYTYENIAVPTGGNTALKYIRFNSTNSHGVTLSDSIISRTWNFGDSSGIMLGNTVSPVHGYAQSGTYNACLYILTHSGCRDTVCHTVVIASAPVNCQPRFTTTATALSVVFNSTTSTVNTGDSIISRSWTFGDGASASNTVNVTHQYAQVGEYQICLTIHTRLGCVSTFCKKIAVINQAGNCVPYFTKEQVAASLRTIRFNSTGAYSQFLNDSIVERKWEFGDGQTLSGNVISPLHTYLHGGTYNVCLKITTAHCDAHWCQSVLVRPLDSTNTDDSVQIVNLYPVPVTTQLNAVVYSSHNNVAAELAIYDVYGIRKWFQSTILPQGNSTHNIPTSQLANGPYIFKVTTIYGVKSRNFYKLN